MPSEIDHVLEASSASVLLAHAEPEADIAASDVARRLPIGVIGYGPKGVCRQSFDARLERPVRDDELPTLAPSCARAAVLDEGPIAANLLP